MGNQYGDRWCVCGGRTDSHLCATVNRGIGDHRRLCWPRDIDIKAATNRTTSAAGIGGVPEPIGKEPYNVGCVYTVS